MDKSYGRNPARRAARTRTRTRDAERSAKYSPLDAHRRLQRSIAWDANDCAWNGS